jgi:2-isopropylmalate synthase
MAPKALQDFHGLTTNFKTERLYSSSRMVSTVRGVKAWLNEVIVEQDAFAHEAGIHRDGMLEERSTYEIKRPEDSASPRPTSSSASTRAATP